MINNYLLIYLYNFIFYQYIEKDPMGNQQEQAQKNG